MALAGQPADDAATLAFGPEFPLDSCECLSDAEVTTILDTHLRSSAAADRPFPRKALEYARRNVGARPLEAVKTEAVHVRQALQDLDFEGTDAGALHVFTHRPVAYGSGLFAFVFPAFLFSLSPRPWTPV